jgi:hypothetical protein
LQDKGTNHKGRKERKEREKEKNKNWFIPQFKLDTLVGNGSSGNLVFK